MVNQHAEARKTRRGESVKTGWAHVQPGWDEGQG